MAQNIEYHVLFTCLMLLSCSQGLKAEEDLPTDAEDHPSARITCPEGANAYGSYCYYFIEDRMTWGEADLFCQNMNSGHLVSLLSQAEDNFVASLVKESGTTVSNVWIGLHDPKNVRQEAKENLPSAWISCPEGSNAYSSHQYNFIEHLLTWAMKTSFDLGHAVIQVFFSQNMNSGFLVSVLNQVEGFVTSLSKDSGTAVTNVWMSGLASLTPKV
ncbi:Lithostathine-2 [Cricetulus griseus]|uniref:Lithostathine-2 n=1 Tax=Cricetulus griseus TaxID=10029 RepID=G3HLP9_CRIGR|nr:Lithostathine-2 [Cricetulus griseus]